MEPLCSTAIPFGKRLSRTQGIEVVFNATDEKELLNAIFKPAVEYPHADNLAGEETRQRLSTRMS